jgi:4-hydroxy-4-methyl-2-oxoglutarate aldolase
VEQSFEEIANIGTATIYEAAGRSGAVDLPLRQLIPGTRVAGPARTAMCAQGDNLMVHAAVAGAQPGDVLVLTMPEPEAVALVGDLLATQAKVRGVAAILVDGAVRDVDDLVEIGLPIWARYVSIKGATKEFPGAVDVPVEVGDALVSPGDVVVLDPDGAVVIEQGRLDEVLTASGERLEREAAKREKLQQGELSYDLDGLRARVETTPDSR